MKLTILASALALCGGLALAQNPSTTGQQTTGTQSTSTKVSDQKMTAEVVSTDATAQRITVRKLTAGETVRSTDMPSSAELPSSDSPTFTLKVSGKALTSLSSFKAGDKVTLSCKGTSGSASSTGTMGGSISSQAVADAQCGTVTDISTAKMR
jgi:hypothetical protein